MLAWLLVSVVLIVMGMMIVMACSMSDDPYSAQHEAGVGFVIAVTGAISLFAFIATIIARTLS